MSKSNLWRNIKYYASYWPFFILAAVLCLAAARLYIYVATPEFEASASLLIKSENKEDDSKNTNTLNLFSSKKILENEIEVLRSYTVVAQAVKNLRLYAPVYKTNRVGASPAYVLSPVSVELRDPDNLMENNNEKIYFEYDPETKTVLIGRTHYPLNTWVNFGRGETRFIENPSFVDNHKRGDFYFSFLKVQKVAERLLLKLDIQTPNKLATVIDLKLPDEIPKRCADILNELMAVYQKADVDDKINVAENALKFLDDRIDHEVAELNSVESNLQEFKSAKGVVDISEQGKQFLNNVGKNDQDLGQVNIQLAILDQLENYLRQNDASTKLIPSMVGLNDPQLAGLVDRLYNQENEFSRIKGSVAENNPIFVSYKNEIDNIRAGIRESIRGLRNNLMVSKTNLDNAGGKYVSSLRSIPQKEKELLELNRKQSIKNEIYTFLLQKREEAVLSNASALSDSRIVDYAQTTILPVKPKKQIIYLGAALLGLGAVAFWLYMKNFLKPVVWSRQDVLENVDMPLVGELPKIREKRNTDLLRIKNETLNEEFRRVRAALGADNPGLQHQKVLIASLQANEGKTVVAMHLANSIASMNKKVLLINLNKNDEAFGSFFNGVTEHPGISEWMNGRNNENEIVLRSNENKNVFFMPFGKGLKENTDLFSDNKFAALFDRLQNNYSSVLVISAPINTSSDAYQLSQWSDATLLTVKRGVTPLKDLANINSSKDILKFKKPAVILL